MAQYNSGLSAQLRGSLAVSDVIGLVVEKAIEAKRFDLAQEMQSALAIGLAMFDEGAFAREFRSRKTSVFAGSEGVDEYEVTAESCTCKGYASRKAMNEKGLPIGVFCSHMVVHWLDVGIVTRSQVVGYLSGIPSKNKEKALGKYRERQIACRGWQPAPVECEPPAPKPEPKKAASAPKPKAAPKKAKAAPVRIPQSFTVTFNAKKGKGIVAALGQKPASQVVLALDVSQREAFQFGKETWGDSFTSISCQRISQAAYEKMVEAGRSVSKFAL